MNKYQMTFGDYYNDGHGQYITVHVASPHTWDTLQEIIDGIYKSYPVLMRRGLAREYDEPFLTKEVWEVVKDFGYPLERMWEYLDDISYDGLPMDVIDKCIENEEISFNVDTIADIWIWMMNKRGAELEYIEAPEMLFHFSDGYGCFLC